MVASVHAHTEAVVQPPSSASKLLIVCTFCAAIYYAESIAFVLQDWDRSIFWLVILLFLYASYIGTKIVLRIAASGGELPANDEMFNLPDLVVPANDTAQPLQSAPAAEQSSARPWFLSKLMWRRGRVNSAAVT